MLNARTRASQLIARLPKTIHPTLWAKAFRTPQPSKPICDLVTDILEHGANNLVLRLLPQ